MGVWEFGGKALIGGGWGVEGWNLRLMAALLHAGKGVGSSLGLG